MTETKLTGRWVFEPTGEVRPPKKGEWYCGAASPVVASNDYERMQFNILRITERPREVTRPCPAAVRLAESVTAHAEEPPYCTACRNIAREILEAEAAFSDGPADPTFEQDAAFVRKLG